MPSSNLWSESHNEAEVLASECLFVIWEADKSVLKENVGQASYCFVFSSCCNEAKWMLQLISVSGQSYTESLELMALFAMTIWFTWVLAALLQHHITKWIKKNDAHCSIDEWSLVHLQFWIRPTIWLFSFQLWTTLPWNMINSWMNLIGCYLHVYF